MDFQVRSGGRSELLITINLSCRNGLHERYIVAMAETELKLCLQ